MVPVYPINRNQQSLTQNPEAWIIAALMTHQRMLKHFGGLTKAAQALGLQRQTVHAWCARNRIPARWQLRLEVLSNGALVADHAAREEALEIASYLRGKGELKKHHKSATYRKRPMP
jgi:hypothetical protein